MLTMQPFDQRVLLQIARLLTVKREREIKQGIDQRTSRKMEMYAFLTASQLCCSVS